MRARLLALAALVLFAAAEARADDDGWKDVPVVALRQAAKDGTISASGKDPAGYSRITLRLRNASKARVAVELSGSYLTPRNRGSCQRLAIGPPVDVTATVTSSGGSSVARLEPGAEREFEVRTCCMDSGLRAPNQQSFDVASESLTEVRETVMRWWVEHPTAPQSAVNQAIWQNVPTVRVEPGVVPEYREPKGSYAVPYGGTYYRLVDGALTSVDDDGLERVYGTGVFQVLPAETGLFAV